MCFIHKKIGKDYFRVLRKCLEISSLELLEFDGGEESFEVSSAEAVVIRSLNYLDKKSRSILDRQAENLQQVSIVVVVDQDILLLNGIKVLLDDALRFFEILSQLRVVRSRWNQELHATSS